MEYGGTHVKDQKEPSEQEMQVWKRLRTDLYYTYIFKKHDDLWEK